MPLVMKCDQCGRYTDWPGGTAWHVHDGFSWKAWVCSSHCLRHWAEGIARLRNEKPFLVSPPATLEEETT